MNGISQSCCGSAADLSPPRPAAARRWAAAIHRLLGAPGYAWLAIAAALLLAAPQQIRPSLVFTGGAVSHIAPFFMLSILAAAYVKTAGADRLIARVFTGNASRMILAAAIFGAFSPFCSCGVIPIVAALLAARVPLAAVMTFWIASPAMDPELFFLIAGTLGVQFALVKTLAVLVLSVAAGYLTLGLTRLGLLGDVLKRPVGGCCGTPSAGGRPDWAFFRKPDARRRFAGDAADSALFLGRWLLLAFMLESLMVAYLPAQEVARWLGAGNAWSIPLAAAAGAPAYMNSYAAIPLVSGLIDLGMSPAVALTFMLSGTITSLPAGIAVWATVRPRAFLLYVGVAGVGAMLAGFVYAAILAAA